MQPLPYPMLLQEAGKPESHARIKKLFVGGLMDSTTEESLRDYFSAYGQVESVDLIEDRETKRKRGFAYVCFNDYDPVDKAVCKYKCLLSPRITVDIL